MGQMVYVLMSLEGTGKVRDWRPVGVVSNPEVAEQWYQYGKGVDWVPLELDDVKNISPEHMPAFQPRKLSPGEERMQQLEKDMQATIQRMQKIIDDQQAVIKKLSRGKQSKFESPLLKEAVDEMPPKPVQKGGAPFPDVLRNAKEIADYIETYATDFVDSERVYEYFHPSHAVLKLVPIASLKEGGREANMRSPKNEAKYLKQNIKTQPPAIVENGKVLDGNHRFRANKRKGLTHMWCYVVMEGGYRDNSNASGDQES